MNQLDTEVVLKGMRGFRYKRQQVLLEDARKSPYFLWWSCLRRSKDYWWVCQRKGIADDLTLRKMYSDFGDVYSMPFEQWWDRKGIHLFAETIDRPDVRVLQPPNLVLSRDTRSYLLLEIPLNLTERTIIKKIREKLREHPDRQVSRESTSLRKLTKYIGLKMDVLLVAMQVWQKNYKSRNTARIHKIGQVQGTKSLYQIGKELRLVTTCMPVITDSKERAAKRVNGMKVATSRMLSRANNLIDNAVVGVFPSIQPCKTPIAWRPIQQERLDAAVAQGLWRPLFDENETISVPLPDA